MPSFLAEVRMSGTGRADAPRIRRMLDIARRRIAGSVDAPLRVAAGFAPESRRLVCVVEAPSAEVVQRLLRTALLPSGVIEEIVQL